MASRITLLTSPKYSLSLRGVDPMPYAGHALLHRELLSRSDRAYYFMKKRTTFGIDVPWLFSANGFQKFCHGRTVFWFSESRDRAYFFTDRIAAAEPGILGFSILRPHDQPESVQEPILRG